MSWVLFNHNVPIDISYVPPDTPITPVATLVYQHATGMSSAIYGYALWGIQIVVNGDTIIAVTSTAHELVRSSDGGDNWSTITGPYSAVDNLPAYSQVYYGYDLQIDPVSGSWYYRCGVDQIGSSSYHYAAFSTDDGASFQLIEPGVGINSSPSDERRISSASCTQKVTETGDLISFGNPSSRGAQFGKYTDPDGTMSYSYALSAQGSVYTFNSCYLNRNFCGDFVGYTLTNRFINYNLDTDAITENFVPSGTLIRSNWATDGVKVIAPGVDGDYYVYYPATAPTKHSYVIDELAPNGDPPKWIGCFYGNGTFIVAWGYSSASGGADYRRLIYFVTSPTGLDGSWSVKNTLTLPLDKDNDDAGYGSYLINLVHVKDDTWYVLYLSYVGLQTTIASFTLPSSTISDNNLFNAFNAQAPDIFYISDELIGATTITDYGRKQYTNTVHGSVVFEQDGLALDQGTAMLFDAATDTGVLVESVPSPVNHAHAYLLKHDGTAAVRVLASSGDEDDPDAFSYYVFLAADHKLGVAVYNDGWEYSYSIATITADTVYLCAIKIEDSGDVTFYIADAWDSIISEVPVVDLSATILSVGGAWTGGTSLSNSADGVTVDYYALIPKETFNYEKLVLANGGIYTGPSAPTELDGGEVIFLVHGDDAVLGGPTDLDGDGTFSWEMLNSVPGTINHIKTEVNTGRIDYSDTKFGAGSFVAPYKSSRDGMKPWDIAYWFEGHQRLDIGYQAFSYDVWFKSLWSNGFGYAGSSQGFYRQSGNWYRFGGITISVSQQPGDPTRGRISISIGTSLGRALDGHGDALTMHWGNIPGYIAGGFNHIAVCRSTGLSVGGPPMGTWNVFINGNKAGTPNVIEGESQAYVYSNILKAGQWMFGSYMWQHPGYPASRYTPPAKFDEARLIVGGRGIYKESFNPPTAPYDYG